MYDSPKLVIVADDRITGVLSKRRFNSFTEAEARERDLLAIAVAVLGRTPSASELHRGQVKGHQVVRRSQWPSELRWSGYSVRQDEPPTREQEIRSAIQQIRERTERKAMTTREQIADESIRRLKAELAELETAAEQKARLAEIQASPEFKTRRDACEVYAVLAGFDLTAPEYELEAVELMRSALKAGDLEEFDRFAVPFRERLDARQADKLAEVNAVASPVIRTVAIVSAALGAE